MKWLLTLIALAPLLSAQVVVQGGVVGRGLTINPPASNYGVNLPQVWVDSNEYVGKTSNTITFPSTGTGGSWTCGATSYGPYTAGSRASLQTAINNAETCRTANGSGTTIVIPAGAVLSATDSLILPQSAGDTSTNFIVLTSSTPLTTGQVPCSHGIQDNVASSTYPGIRNLGCDGSAMSYQLGTTVTSVSGAFTLANGTATNTSAYNDKASMYTIETSGGSGQAVITADPDANNVGPHHYALLNGEFRPAAGLASTQSIIKIGNDSETMTSQIPTHIHVAYSYLHGDWGDAPVSGGVATGPPVGHNVLPNDLFWSACIYCSFTWSYVDKSLRPSAEGHVWAGKLAQSLKIAHVWAEGQSMGNLIGGSSASITIANFDQGQDVEERANRYTYPYSWLLAKEAGFNPTQGSYVRKNAHEVKAALRWLSDGNIFENVDNSGAQGGQNMDWRASNASAGSLGDNYWVKTNHVTLTNSILRNTCVGPLLGSRSSFNSSDGGGIVEGPQNYLYANNLMYNTTTANPGCQGQSNSYGFRIGGNVNGAEWATSAATRDGSGIVTLTLVSTAGGKQTDTNVGDPIQVRACTDTTFNTNAASLGPPALTGTLHDGLTIVYQSGTASAGSTTGCIYNNIQGYVRHLTFSHNTHVDDVANSGWDPYNTQSCGATPWMQARDLSFKDSLILNSGGIGSCWGEGTRSQTKVIDATTLVFNNMVMADRDANVVCPGHLSKAAGGMPVCYTEYSDAHAASTPATVYGTPKSACAGADPTTEDCVGVTGAMSTGTFPMALSDWHSYKLRSDSQFAAGRAHPASDGTDMGADFSKIDAAQVSTQYPGGYPD